MPTYEYACDTCQGHFEYFQGMSEAAKTICESCGGKLSRLVGSGAGLVFKGSGFYITDYKPTGAGQDSGSSAGSASSSPAAETKTSSPETSSSTASNTPSPSSSSVSSTPSDKS